MKSRSACRCRPRPTEGVAVPDRYIDRSSFSLTGEPLSSTDYRMANGNTPRLCKQHLDLWFDRADDDGVPEPVELVRFWGSAPPSTLTMA